MKPEHTRIFIAVCSVVIALCAVSLSPVNGLDEIDIGDYDVSRFSRQEQVAEFTANILTALNSSVTVEFLESLVKFNVQIDPLIYGSAIAFENNTYKQGIFCPYAFRGPTYQPGDPIQYFDLAEGYDYYGLGESVSWYYQPKLLFNATYPETSPGYWTNPYFDDGAGDIWMVTYSKQFWVRVGDDNYFQGIATIDIPLDDIDIDECELGTHNCVSNAICDFIPGAGRVNGSFTCTCEDGHYGVGTESCSACPDGCSSCSSATSCLICAQGYILSGSFCYASVSSKPYVKSEGVRLIFVILSAIFLLLTCLLLVFVIYNRKKRVVKSASPLFLALMLLGAAFHFIWIFLAQSNLNTGICIAQIWILHLGFAILFASLFLKSYRIMRIFKQTFTKNPTALNDFRLMKHFGQILASFIIILTIWTIVGSPSVTTLEISNTLRLSNGASVVVIEEAEICKQDWWDYTVLLLELGYLLWGVYLSYHTRKTPAAFNESKWIGAGVYNWTFIAILVQIVIRSSSLSADAIFAVNSVGIFLTVPLILGLIFIPKIRLILKGNGDAVQTSNFSNGQDSQPSENTQSGLSVPASGASMQMAVKKKEMHHGNFSSDGERNYKQQYDELYQIHKLALSELEKLRVKVTQLQNPHK